MKSLDAAQYAKVLSYACKINGPCGLLIELALLTGARQSEIIALSASSFDFKSNTVAIKSLKGSKRRVIPLPVDTIARIRSYLPAIGSFTLGQGVWPCASPASRPRLFRRAWDNALIESLGERVTKLHGARHTFASRVMRRYLDLNDPDALRKTQAVLGHRNIQNTCVYLEAIESESLGSDVMAAMSAHAK